MNEARSFRRAFAAGLLTLGLAVGGQMATSHVSVGPAVSRCSFRSFGGNVLYVRAPEPERSLAQRIARAVIGAVLDGFA